MSASLVRRVASPGCPRRGVEFRSSCRLTGYAVDERDLTSQGGAAIRFLSPNTACDVGAGGCQRRRDVPANHERHRWAGAHPALTRARDRPSRDEGAVCKGDAGHRRTAGLAFPVPKAAWRRWLTVTQMDKRLGVGHERLAPGEPHPLAGLSRELRRSGKAPIICDAALEQVRGDPTNSRALQPIDIRTVRQRSGTSHSRWNQSLRGPPPGSYRWLLRSVRAIRPQPYLRLLPGYGTTAWYRALQRQSHVQALSGTSNDRPLGRSGFAAVDALRRDGLGVPSRREAHSCSCLSVPMCDSTRGHDGALYVTRVTDVE